MRCVALTAVCGKIEAEIASLSDEDARAFMEDLGLSGSGLARIIEKSYALLGLISFYTAGDPEVRAWTIPRHTSAQKAAGVIHTDFEKGFIKAEVVSFKDMIEFGSFQAAKSKGVLRLEGKDYIVREGDVILFRFSPAAGADRSGKRQRPVMLPAANCPPPAAYCSYGYTPGIRSDPRPGSLAGQSSRRLAGFVPAQDSAARAKHASVGRGRIHARGCHPRGDPSQHRPERIGRGHHSGGLSVRPSCGTHHCRRISTLERKPISTRF